MHRKVALLLAVSGFLGTMGLAQAAQNCSLRISAPATAVRAGAEVKVMVTIANPSDQDVNISEKLLTLHVLDHDGHLVPVPTPEPARDIGKLPRGGAYGSAFLGLLVQPGKSMVFEEVLNKKFDVSKPGNYTVQATWQIGAANIKSNKIKIDVIP